MQMENNIIDNDNPLPPSILKHFLIAGINYSLLKEKKQRPEVISSFTMESNRKEISRIITIVNTDNHIINNIFPCKSDYFNDLDLETINDSPLLQSDLYSKEYITTNCFEPFFHSFIYKYWGEKENYDWYFNCFIFYEELQPNKGTSKQISISVYAAKALIIITRDPYFSLCEKLLSQIYLIATKRKLPSIINPIEPFIIDIFNKLRIDNNNIDLNIEIDELVSYQIRREQFLPVCDMNLYLFFQLFSLSDVLFLAEQFFKKRTVIIISSHVSCLYPIFHTLMTLIHPLNVTDNTYLYRLLTPQLLSVVSSNFSMFLFIYANKIDDEVIENIARIKEYITVINISYKTYIRKATVKKQIYQLATSENSANQKLTISKFPNSSIIHQVINDYAKTELLFDWIQTEIKNLKPNKHNSFFYSDDYIEIRQLFFGLMTRFFVEILPTTSFYITKRNQELVIDFVDIQISEKYNRFIKEFVTTPIFDLVKKVSLEMNANLKDFILLDELIKIIKSDTKRLYYDFKAFDNKPDDNGKDKDNNKKMISLLKIEYKSLYETNRMAYISQIHKHILREKASPSSSMRLMRHDSDYNIHYDSITFNFNLYTSMFRLNMNKVVSKENILLLEIETFHKLLKYGCISLITTQQYTEGAIGLCMSLILINNPTAKWFIDTFLSLYKLFQFSNGFEKVFNFLLSFLYEIILSNDDCNKEFMMKYMESLKAFEILPTVTIVLKFKHKMKSIASDSSISIDNDLEENDNDDKDSFSIINDVNSNNSIGFIMKVISQEVVSECNQGCDGDINTIDDDFKCKKCKKPLIVRTQLDEGDTIIHTLSSPKEMLNRMISTILRNQSVFIKDIKRYYEEWFNDVLNIVFIMKAKYSLLLFR